MPGLLPLIGGVIAGTSSLITDKINYNRQKKVNEQNRQENAYWNQQQRQWAIEDRAYENAYNSPAQQMQRLKEAGLNPHLVYGNGVTASSAKTNNASPSAGTAEATQMPQGIFAGFLDAVMKLVQTDNLRAQRELLEEQKTLTRVNADKATAETGLINWNEQRSRGMYDLDREKTQADIERTKASTDFTLSANERANVELELKKVKQAAELRQIASNIITQRINNAKTEQERINLEAQLAKLKNETEFNKMLMDAGINPSGGTGQITASMLTKIWSWIFGK
ncbi:MAG: DNA pilot protein [Microviridae sp.]|nr:MAG: DNA pilot protein [Microviridae sp.]